MKKLLVLILSFFSLKSYGFLSQCESLFEESELEMAFDADKAVRGEYLTPLKRKILFRVVMGDTVPEIAVRFNKSEVSVTDHVMGMIHNYYLKKRMALASYAIHKSFIDPMLAIKTKGYTVSYFGEEIINPDKEIANEVLGEKSPFRTENKKQLNYIESLILFYRILGFTNKEVAQTIGYSYDSVKNYIKKIMENMNVNTMTAACTKAVWLKMFPLTDDFFINPPSLNEAKVIISKIVQIEAAKTRGVTTTARKQKVIRGLVMGKSTPEIAAYYGMSKVAVDSHILERRERFELKNRVALVSYAIHKSIIDIENPFKGEAQEKLNENENIVLFYSILGLSEKGIARQLNKTATWVNEVRGNIFINLKVKDTAAACAKAVWKKMFPLKDEYFINPPSGEEVRAIVRALQEREVSNF